MASSKPQHDPTTHCFESHHCLAEKPMESKPKKLLLGSSREQQQQQQEKLCCWCDEEGDKLFF
jgi:hypothetical protein